MPADRNSDAILVLRWLLAGTSPSGESVGRVLRPGVVEWVARNGVTLRTGDYLEAWGIEAPAFFQEAVRVERQRVASTLAVMRRISGAYAAHGIDHMFPKAFHHLPDMGGDIDLLTLSASSDAMAVSSKGLDLSTNKGGLEGRIARTTSYSIAGCSSPLEIHHGCLGSVGEHRGYVESLFRNQGRIVVDGTEFGVPSVEDELVMQGMQRVYGRSYIRLSDIICTVRLVQRREMDWDCVVRTAEKTGVFAGLCCYLSYVEQIYRDVFEDNLLPAKVRRVLVTDGWGSVEFKGGLFRFSYARIGVRVYGRQFVAQVAAGRIRDASRLFLLPALVAARGARRLRVRWVRGESPA